ncbi:disease resistance protein Piks-1-like [Panicum virgatum]|uniref:HMA domain-containing protein n=1 Tax=Panicum virgatum TaxID=38727 RepID=A0A8T0WXD1_PANVG|nr:disease resistance protein Piks-1-like [Panicum virgatum]KAG2651905.1 hypothetical protein PVAP13_1NG312700 [Panicum virgatum]
MKQKIVIKVEMPCDRCRSKALSLVAATGGVHSVALAGDARDQVVVVGDGVDPVRLASALRRKVGPAEIVQLASQAKDEGGDKKDAAPVPAGVPAQYAPTAWYYQHPPPPPVSVVCEPPAAGYAYGYQARADDESCSIM